MSDEPKDVQSWSDLPEEERIALRRAAQSQIWWTQLGQRVRGMGPIVTAVLAIIALWQMMGEAVKAGVETWLGK